MNREALLKKLSEIGIDVSISDHEHFLIDESDRAIDWSINASSVIFGAILSAYAGIKISALPENYINALAIFLICICHVTFLFCIIAYSSKIRNLSSNTKFYYYGSSFLCAAIATFVWHYVFGSSLFYTIIIFGWLFSHVMFAKVIDRARRPIEGRVELLKNLAEHLKEGNITVPRGKRDEL